MMEKEKCIAIFDSGVGGLTAVKAFKKLLPNENIVYFADTKNLPYGDKSKEEIVTLVLNAIEFLKHFDPKAVLIACGTADSNALELIKKNYDLPLFGVIQPACLKANEISRNHNIGVMATQASVSANGYGKGLFKINPTLNIYQKGCPKLTPLIEEGKTNKKAINEALDSYLNDLTKYQIDTLILGCTHYPLLEEEISEKVNDIKIVNASYQAVVALKKYLQDKNLLNESGNNSQFYVSSAPNTFERNARLFLETEIEAKMI